MKGLPSSNVDLYTEAYLLYEKGHMDEAIAAFSLLTLLMPLETNHWFGLAASWQAKQEYQKALDAWSMASYLAPENPFPPFYAAECLLSQNNPKEARVAFQSAEKKNPPEDLLRKIEIYKTMWNLH